MWNLLLLVFIIYQCITIPFRLSFNIPIVGGWRILEDIITAMFLIDVVINFNTGFYRKGNLIVSRKKIAINYIKFWFWLDLLASFPYDWIMAAIFGERESSAAEQEQSQDSLYKTPQLLRIIKIFRFLRILKLIRICKVNQILMKMEDFIISNTFSTTFIIIKLFATIAFIAHWTACWFYYISYEDSFVFADVWIR
jgi:hyperpolarization activated cyclic nucleotide-gated potassium channel 2